MCCIFFFSRIIICQTQQLHIVTNLWHVLLVFVLFYFRVSLSIFSYVRKTISFCRIWPVIRSKAHVIMLVSAWRIILFFHHTHRPKIQCLICIFQEFFISRLQCSIVAYFFLMLLQRFCTQGKNFWLPFLSRKLSGRAANQQIYQ